MSLAGPVELPFDDFLVLVQCATQGTVNHDSATQEVQFVTPSPENGIMTLYTHPSLENSDPDKYVSFMVKLKQEFDRRRA